MGVPHARGHLVARRASKRFQEAKEQRLPRRIEREELRRDDPGRVAGRAADVAEDLLAPILRIGDAAYDIDGARKWLAPRLDEGEDLAG